MQRENQFSDDVIKIFHNVKGSLRNKIMEWTANENSNSTNEQERLNSEWNPYAETPFDHAAGEYEPLSEDNPYCISESGKDKPMFKAKPVSEFPRQSTLRQKVDQHSKDDSPPSDEA